MTETEVSIPPTNLDAANQAVGASEYPEPVCISQPVNLNAEPKIHSRLWRPAGKLALFGAVILPGAAGGAITAVNEFPVPVRIAPGISADVSPQRAGYSSIQLGPTKIGFPKAHSEIYGNKFGLNLDVTEFDTGTDNTSQTLRATLESPEHILRSSKMEAKLIRRGVEGGIAGALATGAGLLGLLSLSKRRKRKIAEDEDRLERLIDHRDNPSDDIAEATKEKDSAELKKLAREKEARRKHRLIRKIGSLSLVTSLVVTGAAGIKHEVSSLSTKPISPTTILSSRSSNTYVKKLVEENPVLEDTFMTGDIGDATHQAINTATEHMNKVDQDWQQKSEFVVDKLLPQLREKGGGLDWQDNPEVVTFVNLTDIHDNHSFLKNYLPAVLKAIGPNFIINTGDETNWSGQVILDDGAWKRLADALPDDTPTIIVPGNHDAVNPTAARKMLIKGADGKWYHPFTILGKSNNYTTELDGINFVGSPDLNRTNDKGTVPRTHAGQMKNDARQGRLLNQRACDVYKSTGEKPIVLAHEPESTYPSVLGECVQLALSGHKHHTQPIKAYKNQDGSISLWQNLGSASGTGPNDLGSLFNGPTISADLTVWQYNKVTKQYQSVIISVRPHGTPIAKKQEVPAPDQAKPPAEDPDIVAFVYQNEDVLSQTRN